MKKMIISLVLVVSVIIGFYGSAWAPGGAPDPTPFCPSPLPAPDSGRFIRGEFTAAVDKIGIGDDAHYNVHVILKMGYETHLFSFIVPKDDDSICSFGSQELEESFAYQPCLLGVGSAFGLSGMPVIASLTIEDEDFCDHPLYQMIRGQVVIRVVPTE